MSRLEQLVAEINDALDGYDCYDPCYVCKQLASKTDWVYDQWLEFYWQQHDIQEKRDEESVRAKTKRRLYESKN